MARSLEGQVPCGRLASPSLQQLLRALGETRPFQRGERLVEEGDPPAHLGLVLDGQVRIVRLGAGGRDLTLHRAGPGQAFGLIPALDRAPYPASVEGLVPGHWCRVESRRFLEALQQHPDLALEALTGFGQRIRHLVTVSQENSLARVPCRIAARLLEAAGTDGEAIITRQELADLAGTTVETAIRTTRQWEKLGWVRLHRGRITLLDPGALASLTRED